MHKAKLDAAFACLSDVSGTFSEEIEIYDWGCGQGTASVCLLDFLHAKQIKTDKMVINLIDPSVPATQRAKDVISCFDRNISINIINKVFDDLDENDFIPSNRRKLHLFSNILDVDAFDLAQFTLLFQKSFKGSNHFVCVGPYYSNNKRVDDFIAAIAPDAMYATYNKERGTWQNDWTISLRVFFKEFGLVESISNIRRRIEESHKKDQFFAGYILDSVSEEYVDSDIREEIEGLFKSLSVFDVKSNKPLEKANDCDPKIAVMANIVSRGLPTIAPILVENIFSDAFEVSIKPKENAIISYKSKHKISKTDIDEALHIIDPRFDVDFYNGDMLESQFEKDFIAKYLKGTDCEYLIQILEPQRPLSSIVNIPNRRFSKDQRVDFAIEKPYGEEQKIGFIFELDGTPYHSNIFQKLRDERRDRLSAESGWDTYRLERFEDYSFLQNWEQEASLNKYLSIIKHNSKKVIDGAWKDKLQVVLSPLAIARVERMLLQALLSDMLDFSSDKWNILIVERDVPCGAIAIELLKESFEKITAMDGSNKKLPKINLSIVSSKEFIDSKLHLDKHVETSIPARDFDLCVDISMLLRDNIDALPLNVKANTVYIVRSSHYQKRERTICSADNIKYLPFVTKDATGKYVAIKEREQLLTYFLQNIFRKPSFRQGQLPILSRSLSNKTTIGLLPTGGGKSLTYQLSSILQPGVTIIVDPLVSLMVDQVNGLHELRIDTSDCINSSMDGKTKAKKLNSLQRGSLQFVLLSPERYMMEKFRESLVSMTEKNHIYFAYGVIDEVHCVSEWGHDFRPSYLHLGRNMVKYMRPKSGLLSIIGLTATASFDVLADVERELTLGGNLSIDSETIVRSEDDTRPELSYRIVNIESDFESLRDENNPYLLKAHSERDLKDIVATSKKRRMYELLKEIPSDIEQFNIIKKYQECHLQNYVASQFYDADENGKFNNAGIIFCPHAHGTFGVKDTEWGTHNSISTYLMAMYDNSLQIGTFIGGDKPSGDMKRFKEDNLNLMVATKAFGMGIDKPNVRFTINFNHPSSIESFVQEAGRAGRDKKHAISYILYDSAEYIHFTADKIKCLSEMLKTHNLDPRWLGNFNNEIFVLCSDFLALCNQYCNEDISRQLLSECRNKGFIQNVDKDIVLWFHNNSFRGSYKERVILQEMTDRILNVKPTYLKKVEGLLIEETGNEDVLLKLDLNKNAVKILSKENKQNQYGYIYLNNLSPHFKFIAFDFSICKYISDTLINILSRYQDHSAQALLRPLEGTDNIEEGIYSAMAKADADGYVFVTVTWENQIQQDAEQFEQNIRTEISNIANKKGWNNINEDRYGKLNFKVNDFSELIAQISKCSNDANWLYYQEESEIYGKLKHLYSKKRDKDDTDKAIYRLCCIGLVEDVTIDYLSQTYELKIRNRTDEEYKQSMLDFFLKYYSVEQARKKVEQIDNHKGRNYIDKCLGYLADFVYENLERKRFRAIEDMRIACEESIAHREVDHNDEWLKEFIHLYFNSKYARRDYKINGECYSLSKDTDEEGNDDFNLVMKYIEIVSKDNSGSEVDNLKHLYGATLLCLRAHPDNAALLLLLTYSIALLGAGNNETLQTNAINGYIEGFMLLYEKVGHEIWKYIDQFNELLALKSKEDFIKNNLVDNGKEKLMLFIHERKFNDFTRKYTNKEDNESNNDKK